MKKILNFINGEFVEPTSKEYLENVSPINDHSPPTQMKEMSRLMLKSLTGTTKLLIEIFFS